MTRDALRAVVCGTNFGRFYAEALRRAPGYELSGILSRGSAHSAKYANALGVPRYTAIDELPADVDVACVAVPSSVTGGDGSTLAVELLRRGLHVLQEHPLLPDEMASGLRAARANDRQYRINTHYPRLPQVRRFLDAADRLRATQEILLADVAAPVHLLHPAVDIVSAAVGGPRPWRLGEPSPVGPVRALAGEIGGVPIALRVHHQLDPADPDNHALFWPRITLVASGGTLTLADVHGPVLWSPRLHAPRDEHHRLVLEGGSLELPSTSVLGPDAGHQPSFAEHFRDAWPAAIGDALDALATAIAGSVDPLHSGQRDLAVCRCWHDLTVGLGPPEPIRPATPRPVSAAELMAATTDGAP